MPAVEQVFRAEYGRSVAVLVRVFGDIDVAEEAVQDAFAEAVKRWPETGVPPSPAGWIITTARRRAIDRLRRSPRGTPGRPRPRCCTPVRTMSRWTRWVTSGCG